MRVHEGDGHGVFSVQRGLVSVAAVHGVHHVSHLLPGRPNGVLTLLCQFSGRGPYRNWLGITQEVVTERESQTNREQREERKRCRTEEERNRSSPRQQSFRVGILASKALRYRASPDRWEAGGGRGPPYACQGCGSTAALGLGRGGEGCRPR